MNEEKKRRERHGGVSLDSGFLRLSEDSPMGAEEGGGRGGGEAEDLGHLILHDNPSSPLSLSPFSLLSLLFISPASLVLKGIGSRDLFSEIFS